MTLRIAILVEGATESAFKKPLIEFLQAKLDTQKMPKLDFLPEYGRIPKEAKLRRKVELLLKSNDAVIALTDVYTGGNPPDFTDAYDARTKMRNWVGIEPRFYPHAAQHDFEAWLLPYWSRIQKLAGSQRNAPSPNPETVNHQRPPSYVLTEIFRTGVAARRYSKTRDAAAILRDQDLQESAARCPELKDFLNTILKLSGGQLL